MFSKFSRYMSKILGNSLAFSIAVILVLLWIALGPIFNYSDSWEMVINTVTTIITFLMVFLLQSSQNRDTMALHLKLDEIIRALENTHNNLVKIEDETDENIELLLKDYKELATFIKSDLKNGKSDKGSPDINTLRK